MIVINTAKQYKKAISIYAIQVSIQHSQLFMAYTALLLTLIYPDTLKHGGNMTVSSTIVLSFRLSREMSSMLDSDLSSIYNII